MARQKRDEEPHDPGARVIAKIITHRNLIFAARDMQIPSWLLPAVSVCGKMTLGPLACVLSLQALIFKNWSNSPLTTVRSATRAWRC